MSGISARSTSGPVILSSGGVTDHRGDTGYEEGSAIIGMIAPRANDRYMIAER